jgi:hypothetical protein
MLSYFTLTFVTAKFAKFALEIMHLSTSTISFDRTH